MNPEKSQEILEMHRLWLEDDEEGEMANLQRADFQEADLRRVDLQRADFQEADLRRVDLRGADLRGANLQRADFQEADLRRVDLRGADLRGAYLRGANLDFSCWPLWCGSLDVKVDTRIARQLAYHLCRLDCDDEEYLKVRDAIKDFANKFHRMEECGRIELKNENKPEVKDYWQGLLSEGEEYDV